MQKMNIDHGMCGQDMVRNTSHEPRPFVSLKAISLVICHLLPKLPFIFCLLTTPSSSPIDICFCARIKLGLFFFSEMVGFKKKVMPSLTQDALSPSEDMFFPGQRQLSTNAQRSQSSSIS